LEWALWAAWWAKEWAWSELEWAWVLALLELLEAGLLWSVWGLGAVGWLGRRRRR